MKASASISSIIDPSVFISLAIAATISLATLGYRFYHFEPCREIEISVKQGLLYVGEIIQFKAIGHSVGGELEWNFGTDEYFSKTGTVVNHTFNQIGRYEVILTANNNCKTYKTIYVQEAPPVVDENLVAWFSGPEMAEVGAPVSFEDTTEGASEWKWWFGENNFVDATSRKATYTFETPGKKKVRLLVNGNRVGEKMIEVYAPKAPSRPAPAPKRKSSIQVPERTILEPIQPQIEDESPAEKIFPEISTQRMKAILNGIVEGSSSVTEFIPYLCAGEHMDINYNGRVMSLSELNAELRDVKKIRRIKNLDVKVSRNPNNNCIISMTIILEEKGFPFF
ncbi:PKD domain-containing protein [Cyclobacterium plantarum]|uniref:PKD domain-containing protein n=1 Tax=Cyclobacterium plantarum TaxID=2716263 RepID=A0ABX0HE97_9BACT|nr:PKD domain-containing protein [Cyclobacterium plantarum]NHE58501.1 PKD domain-containing protein [Cyclobacterium plantarum]